MPEENLRHPRLPPPSRSLNETLCSYQFNAQAMNRFVKPKLDKDHLGKVKELTATQMVKLEAICEAQPQAKFQWFLPNGETLLQDNDRIHIDNDKNRYAWPQDL